MLDLVFLHAANHLIAARHWAGERLMPFAGQRARLVVGALTLDFRIAADGSLESLGSGLPAVEITLPGRALLRLSKGRSALMREARIAGTADFADALGFVLRHLDWDAEEDLSHWLGDIAAHRLMRVARATHVAHHDRLQRMQENVEEFLRYERPPGVRRDEMRAFREDIEELDARTRALEARLARLANRC